MAKKFSTVQLNGKLNFFFSIPTLCITPVKLSVILESTGISNLLLNPPIYKILLSKFNSVRKPYKTEIQHKY
jgi:hypothetical protein